MKKQLLFILSAAFLALVSCHKPDPAVKDPVMVSIPIRLSSQVTKVAYDGTGYSIKSGDKLRISGVSRTDISALLDYSSASGEWSGDLWYDAGQSEPENGTALAATLIHAGNTDESTYAHGCAANFQTAVETLSLFTGSLEFGDEQVTLHQQTSFVNATITFNFTGTGSMATGETSVEVIIGNETIASGSAVIGNGAVSGTYTSCFTLALPGGTTLTDGGAFMRVCDRDIPMRESGAAAATLAANKSYSINRSCDFKPELGDPYWSDGTYGRISHRPGVEVVGIIVYVNNDDTEDSRALTEYSYGYGHALVMALHNAAEGVAWGEKTLHTEKITTSNQVVATTNVSGYNNTTSLETAVTAAIAARNYRSDQNDTHIHDSGWFLPSIGQWLYSISVEGFGGADPVDQWTLNDTNHTQWLGNAAIGNALVYVKSGSTNENLLVKSLNDRLEVLKTDFGCAYDSFGMTVGSDFSDNYWSSSEYDASNAIRLNFGSVEHKGSVYYTTIKINKEDKSKTWTWKEAFPMKVRPFLAF